MGKKILKFLPLLLLLVVGIFARQMGWGEYLSLEAVKEHRKALLLLVYRYPAAAPLLYMLLYAVMVAFSIPGAALLSLVGGFLFPQPWATLLVVIGATVGAIILFLAAKSAFGDLLRERAGGFLHKMERGFREDAASYLLFLRLVPAFPFWLVNLAPAFFGVPLGTFAWTTLVGILPGAFVFTQAGAGLGAILDSDQPFSLAGIFNLQVRIALVALGLFALLPVVVKKWRKHHAG